MSDYRAARLLLVEDSPLQHEIARSVLESVGRDVDVVTDGESAVEACQHRHYDVILMDLGLPGIDGWVASAAIRRMEGSSSRVPILALTSKSGDAVRDKCRAAGMDGFIAKPFAAADLVDHVARWADRRQEATHSVWDKRPLDELIARIGASKVRDALLAFDEKLRLAIKELRAASDDRSCVERVAHNLVSTAGMLGFVELGAVSRDVMRAASQGAAAEISRLEGAAERVLDALTDWAQAASA